MESTFVLIKTDGVKRKLVGEIIARFEKCGLGIEELQLVRATRDLIDRHYPNNEGWLRKVGEKTIKTYETYGMDALKELGTADTLEIGRKVKNWLIEYLISGPVVAIVVSGNHAVEVVRKIVGDTIPLFAAPGSIRSDYAIDSPDLANAEHRAVANLVHASGNSPEAEQEIRLWFPSYSLK